MLYRGGNGNSLTFQYTWKRSQIVEIGKAAYDNSVFRRLWELYECEFSPHFRFLMKLQYTPHGRSGIEIPAQLVLNLEANAKFTGVYLSKDCLPNLLDTIELLLNNHEFITDSSAANGFRTPSSPERDSIFSVKISADPLDAWIGEVDKQDGITQLRNVPFSKRVYLYVESALDEATRNKIHSIADFSGHSVVIRDLSYAAKIGNEPPDAFICHDSRDKEKVARVVAEGLKSHGCRVWYDEYSLKPGDSISEKINIGLKSVNHVVVVLSPNFLAKGGWSKREYEIAYTREIVKRETVLLPIWVDVSLDQIYEFSPLLCDRKAIDWDLGPSTVCEQLYLAIANAKEKRIESN